MLARKCLPAVALVLLAALAPNAQATTHVNYTLSDPSYTYSSYYPVESGFAHELFVENQNMPDAASTLRIDLRDDLPGHQLLDSTSLTTDGLAGYTPAFWADLTLTQNGINNWSAAGAVSFIDNDTSSPAFDALFQSTGVRLNGHRLSITGNLTPRDGQGTILVNRGSPWVFTGNTDGTPDADGNPLTVTQYYPSWFGQGTATFLCDLPVDDPFFDNLAGVDDLLGNSFTATGGSAYGTATIPEPLTLIGFAALAALPVYIRRRKARQG